MIKFRTFHQYCEYRDHQKVVMSPTNQINEWLEENPDVEIISWQATPVGNPSELYITIQYKEAD